MPHRAGSSNQFERGMAGSGSPTLSSTGSGAAFQSQRIPPTASTPSPHYQRTFSGGLQIDSSYQNHQPVPWYPYEGIHRVEPSPSDPGINSFKRLQEKMPTLHELLPLDRDLERHLSQRNNVHSIPQPSKAASVDSAEAAAVSALLLASTESTPVGLKKDVTASEANDCPEGSVPLKKRKKHLDFLRRNQGAYEISTESQKDHPCHISPVSSSSIGSGVHLEEQQPEDSASVSSSKMPLVLSSEQVEPSTSRTNSYDINEAQALPEAAKIKDSTEICSSEHSILVVDNFPTILHHALTHPDYISVLQWLPHGEAWKVLRWDALRREVLPKFFPELREDEGKGCGSIDAFLLQVRIWDFEEIKDGPDVGAYRHMMFLREEPHLCQSMRPCPSSRSRGEDHSPPRPPSYDDKKTAVSSPQSFRAGLTGHSILRVPSLTKPEGDGTPKFSVSPITRPGADCSYSHSGETSSFELRGASNHKLLLSPPHSWPPNRAMESIAPCHKYRPDESLAVAAYADSWLPHPAARPSFLTRMPSAQSCLPPSFDVRFSFRPSYVSAESGYLPQKQQHLGSSQPHFSPPQVRSGRGALRVATRSRDRHQYEQQPKRAGGGGASYPVSHRGRGVSASLACRVPLPSVDLSSSLQPEEPTGRKEAAASVSVSRLGDASCSKSELESHLQTNRIDTSTRKSKRKLPMARKSSLARAETATEL